MIARCSPVLQKLKSTELVVMPLLLLAISTPHQQVLLSWLLCLFEPLACVLCHTAVLLVKNTLLMLHHTDT